MNYAHTLKTKLKALGGLVLCAFVPAIGVVFACVNFGSVPNGRTFYYIDDENRYYSPPLMECDPRPFAYSMFTQDAIEEGFEPLDNRIEAQTDFDGIVYANPKTMKWVVRWETRDHILVSTITREELRLDIPDRKPDTKHRDAGGFQDWCGPVVWALRKLGLADPRFTSEGGWNW